MKELATEEEWRDPEDLSRANADARRSLKTAGVLSSSAVCVMVSTTNSGFTFCPAGPEHVGITGYFNRRITQHKIDTIEGFTKKYQCHRLVY